MSKINEYRGILTINGKVNYEVITKKIKIKGIDNYVEIVKEIYLNGEPVYNIKKDNLEEYLMCLKSKYYKKLFKFHGYKYLINFIQSFNGRKIEKTLYLNIELKLFLELKCENGMLVIIKTKEHFDTLKNDIAFYIKDQAELSLLGCIYEDIYNKYGANLTGYKDNRYLLQSK